MEMHSQECWLPADNGACVAAMTLKSQKNAPQVFPGFPIIKSARHCGKITIFEKTCVLWARFLLRRDVYVFMCMSALYIVCFRCAYLCIYSILDVYHVHMNVWIYGKIAGMGTMWWPGLLAPHGAAKAKVAAQWYVSWYVSMVFIINGDMYIYIYIYIYHIININAVTIGKK